MKIFIFSGPTLAGVAKDRELDAIYLPPAEAGDVYRASLLRPHAIGIIDGYFQSRPTVRHKEILWAMTQGIHVFGSASMGALRAAELHVFGMQGVGSIFAAYRDGVLEDDDEVAIAHSPAEDGYVPLSDAMVNIRQTLHTAAETHVISAPIAAELEALAKNLFYPKRNYSAILSLAGKHGLSTNELESFRQWLPAGRVDQKRKDAIEMLRVIRQKITRESKPKTVAFAFQNTSMWESARLRAGDFRIQSDGALTTARLDPVLDELRINPNAYRHSRLVANERYFAIRESYRLEMTVTDEERRKMRRRIENQVKSTTRLGSGRLAENDLTEEELNSLVEDEVRLEWVRHRLRFATLPGLVDHLHVTGAYSPLRRRAVEKAAFLTEMGYENVTVDQADVKETELLRWYFDEVIKEPPPANLRSYTRDLDWPSIDDFKRVIFREFLFQKSRGSNATHD